MARAMQSAPVGSDGARQISIAREVHGTQSFTVKRIDLWSVARVSIVFWCSVGAVVITAFLFAWAILASAGAVGNFERFVTDVTGVRHFHVMSNTVLAVMALATLLATFVSLALTVLAAAAYNALASLVGGVKVDLCLETE